MTESPSSSTRPQRVNAPGSRPQFLERVVSTPIHPLIIAIYPLLALMAVNIHVIPLSDSFRSMLISVLAMVGALLLSRVLVRDWHLAAAFVSLVIVLFFSYGHVYSLIKPVEVMGQAIGRHRYLIAAWSGIGILAFFWLRIKVKQPINITQALNAISLFLLILPSVKILEFEVQNYPDRLSTQTDPSKEETPLNASVSRPDIYYIIVDGYARADILQTIYGYDNTDFVQFLQQYGFYVADESQANYMFSSLSIGSSLNMTYIQDLGVDFDKVTYPEFLTDYIHHSAVRQRLEAYGYSTVTVPTGYIPTDIKDSDYLITPELNALEALQEGEVLNTFEGLLLTTSVLRIATDLQSESDANWFARQLEYPAHLHRLRVLSAFRNLNTIPYIPGPKFVFMHIVSPHRPYLFGPEGEEIDPGGVFTFKEIDELPSRETSNAYLAQLTFITSLIEHGIDSILSRSAEAPIIIIQSDHGPGLGLDWESPGQVNLADRASILNAYYLPDACKQLLYPSISPVNSFRVVFGCIFGEAIELLPDVSYFSNVRYSTLTEPWIFIPIDELADEANP